MEKQTKEEQAKQDQNWWQKNRKPVFGLVAFVASGLVIVLLVLEVRLYGTGFAGKTLFDCLTLIGVLAVPIMVGLGIAWVTRTQQLRDQEREKLQHDRDVLLADQRAKAEHEAVEQRAKAERDVAIDNQREVALQAYLDKMSELLLENRLLESNEDEEIRKIARMRTITVLKQLNAERIGYVFTFLRETGLMTTTSNNNVLRLNDADLREVKWAHADLFEANLYWANLTKADLSLAYLRRACLSRAILNEADLTGAYLNEVDLTGAYLNGTILTKADLTEANFTGANLSYADLRGADLRGANFVDAKLEGAKLKGARYNREREEKLDALRRPIRDAMIEPTQWPQGFNPMTAGATVERIDLSPYQF